MNIERDNKFYDAQMDHLVTVPEKQTNDATILTEEKHQNPKF